MIPSVFQTAAEHLANRKQVLEIAVKSERSRGFNKVLGVDYDSGTIFLPKLVGKPRSQPWAIADTQTFAVAVWSTMRIDATQTMGTTFAVSPNMCFTSDHVIGPFSHHRCMKGGMVQAELFDLELESRPSYHLHVVGTDKVADIALLEMSGALESRFENMLLPCSPRNTAKVMLLSFPGVTRFLLNARAELIDNEKRTGSPSIWETYKGVMAKELEDALVQVAENSTDEPDESLKRKAKEMVRRSLFRELHETFGYFVSGSMTASVGSVREMSSGFVSTTYSCLTGRRKRTSDRFIAGYGDMLALCRCLLRLVAHNTSGFKLPDAKAFKIFK